MRRLLKTRSFLFVLVLFLFFSAKTAVLAQTVVETLPDNNLVENPWFRNGNEPSLEGWVDAAGSNVIWSLSQKRSNPTPDQVQGTSARLAFGSGQGGGTGEGGVDAYLYQVVAAEPDLNHLQFKIHWVTQWIDRATVTIYGGDSSTGPWTAVWVPLDVDQSTSSGGAWTQTELLDTTIAEGYPFYKIELFGRYPNGRQQGVKYTGVYFSVDDNAGAIATPLPEGPTPTATATNPTLVPVEETVVIPTETPVPAIEAEEEPETAVSAVTTREPQPTRPSARPTQPARSTPQTDTAAEIEINTATPDTDGISGIYLLIIGILLLLVIVLGIGWFRAARR